MWPKIPNSRILVRFLQQIFKSINIFRWVRIEIGQILQIDPISLHLPMQALQSNPMVLHGREKGRSIIPLVAGNAEVPADRFGNSVMDLKLDANPARLRFVRGNVHIPEVFLECILFEFIESLPVDEVATVGSGHFPITREGPTFGKNVFLFSISLNQLDWDIINPFHVKIC